MQPLSIHNNMPVIFCHIYNITLVNYPHDITGSHAKIPSITMIYQNSDIKAISPKTSSSDLGQLPFFGHHQAITKQAAGMSVKEGDLYRFQAANSMVYGCL